MSTLKERFDEQVPIGGNEAFNNLRNEILSFIESELALRDEMWRKKTEGLKCAVPKNPFPRNLNDLETLTVKRIDDCLKYAGRLNYNRALTDLLSTDLSKESAPTKWTLTAPQNYRYMHSRGFIEAICEHGIGHHKGVHGCDGCCKEYCEITLKVI